ncbi:LysR family transcriptional regulator [Microbulbifer sp. JMSA008]|uniref:LysR family transcriptional regulator n=1 Tax=Microbulbifer sp. JMSA008 TaxID=3243373 RepID=UPI00403910DC
MHKCKMMDWNDLRYLIAVADHGSLQSAAKALGVNHSTAWRRLQALEKDLGCQLFVADRQGYFLTDEGNAALEHARKAAENINAIALNTGIKNLEMEGIIRITSIGSYSYEVIPKLCAAFRLHHPKVEFELIDSAEHLSLEKREADIAFRGSPSAPDNLIAKKLFDINWHIFAHPDLVSGPMTLDEIKQQNIIGYRGLSLPIGRWSEKIFKNSRKVIYCNSVMAAAGAANAKLGFAILPEGDQKMVQPYKLKRVFELKEFQSHFWLLSHPQMRNSARVKAFWDFSLDTFKKGCL